MIPDGAILRSTQSVVYATYILIKYQILNILWKRKRRVVQTIRKLEGEKILPKSQEIWKSNLFQDKIQGVPA